MFTLNKKIAISCSALFLLASCAKFTTNEFLADKPDSVIAQEDIDAYPALKSFINRSSHPNFKLGMALTSAGFMNQDITYRIADKNFDELVLENEMKHGAIVQADGSLDLTGVKSFLSVADAAKFSVFGHTLATHSGQNATYLNGLITGASGTTIVNFENDNIGTTYPMTGNSTAVVQPDPAGVSGKMLLVGNAATMTNQSFPKIPVTLPPGIKLGHCNTVTMDIFIISGLYGSGMRLGLVDGGNATYGNAASFGASTNIWLRGKVILPIANLNLTNAQKELTSFSLYMGSATGAGHYYLDNIIISWNAQKTAEEKNTLIDGALNRFISGMVDTCKPLVKAWDVVKDPMDDVNPTQLKTGIGKTLGANDFYWQDYMGYNYAARAFQMARQHANSGDKLFISDYNLETNLNKCRGLIGYIQHIEGQGAIVDGISTQMHISITTDKNNIAEHFRLLAATGKLIRISELDVSLNGVVSSAATEAQLQSQAEMYRYVVEKYFELVPAPQRSGITLWSPQDRPSNASWLANQPVGIWNSQWVRKASYKAIAEALKK